MWLYDSYNQCPDKDKHTIHHSIQVLLFSGGCVFHTHFDRENSDCLPHCNTILVTEITIRRTFRRGNPQKGSGLMVYMFVFLKPVQTNWLEIFFPTYSTHYWGLRFPPALKGHRYYRCQRRLNVSLREKPMSLVMKCFERLVIVHKHLPQQEPGHIPICPPTQ